MRRKARRYSSTPGKGKGVTDTEKGAFSTGQAAAAFRVHGLKVTAQRMAVMSALEQARDHPTAEELHAHLRIAVPGLALKTVYAVLHELAQLRLVEPIPMSVGATRWEPNTAPHAHFVCDNCALLTCRSIPRCCSRWPSARIAASGWCGPSCSCTASATVALTSNPERLAPRRRAALQLQQSSLGPAGKRTIPAPRLAPVAVIVRYRSCAV